MKTYGLGEKRRFKKIGKFVKGETLNIGAYGTNQHKMLKKYSEKLYSLDISNADFNMDLNNLPNISLFSGKKFDTVVLAEVIEHLKNPSKVINYFTQIIKKGGKLIVTTPNAIGLHYLLNPGWCVSDENFVVGGKEIENHINCFTLPMLEVFLKKAGLTVIYKGYINSFWNRKIPFILGEFIPRIRSDLIIVGKK